MKKLYSVSVVLLMSVLQSSADSLVIAERGAQGAISIDSPDMPSAVYAAEELRDYTERMTGVRLAIVTNSAAASTVSIRYGETSEDGFRLKVEDGRLQISGGRRGMLYGVYELLETYGGVGWFSSWCETIPKFTRFEVPSDLDREETPAFRHRELHWKDAFEADFAARLRINGTWHVKTTAKHGQGADIFGAGLGRCHTFDTLLPPEQYFAEHPEYFCEINGKRVNRKPQPCLTNPEVLRIMTSNLLGRIATASGSPYFGVSQNDNLNFCRCRNCSMIDAEEGSHSGTMVRFINKVADVVSKEHPDKIVETLAYMYTRKPPKTERYRPNVMPCLCTLECDFSRPLELSRFHENVLFMKDLKGWHDQVKQLYIWDYTTDFHHYLKPFENLKVLQPNLKLFRRMGVIGVFEQGAYQGWHGEMAELKVWLLAKLLWNPEADVEALTRKFLDGYYGKAAPWVAEYLRLLYGFERDETSAPVRIFDAVGKDPVLTDEFFARATELWRKAAKEVLDDPVRSYNVQMGAMAVDYSNYMKYYRPLNVSKKRLPCDAELPRRLEKALATADAAKRPVALCESWTASASRRRQIASDAKHGQVIGDGKTAIVEESAFTLHAGRGVAEFRKDQQADDGAALWLTNNNWEWYAQLDLNRVAADADKDYCIRIRVRVELAGGAGEAFSFGIYDTNTKKNTACRSIADSQVKQGYAWYELPICRLSDDQLLWFAAGHFDGAKTRTSPVHNGIWIDKLEIRRK